MTVDVGGIAWPALGTIPTAEPMERPRALAAPQARALSPAAGVEDVAMEVAQALLDELVLALGDTPGGPVRRAAVYPGEEMAPMDECCAGQAAVRVYRLFPITGRFPQQNHGPKNCSELNSYGITLEMTVYRCASTMRSDGGPPSAENLTDDSRTQLGDASAMRHAIRTFAPLLAAMPYGASTLFVEDDYNPVGPAGDCLGGRQRCTFGFYDLS